MRSKDPGAAGQDTQEGLTVIEMCRRPLSTADGWIAEQVDGLWEDWIRQVDQVLCDPDWCNWSTRC